MVNFCEYQAWSRQQLQMSPAFKSRTGGQIQNWRFAIQRTIKSVMGAPHSLNQAIDFLHSKSIKVDFVWVYIWRQRSECGV